MPELVKIDRSNPQKELLDRASAVMREGGVAIYPTETAYAIGCSINRAEAVNRIYSIKNRSRVMPLPVIMSGPVMVSKFISYVPETAKKLTKTFMPGPVTLVLKAGEHIPEYFLGPEGTLAFRISSCLISREIARLTGWPVVSTSANISGETEVRRISDLTEEFAKQVDIIIDSGVITAHSVSTIVEVNEKNWKILREGEIPAAEIERCLHE